MRILILPFALSACATATPPTVVEVPKPVTVYCEPASVPAPAFAVDALAIDADIWDQVTALQAERLQRKAYETKLTAALESCRRKPAP